MGRPVSRASLESPDCFQRIPIGLEVQILPVQIFRVFGFKKRSSGFSQVYTTCYGLQDHGEGTIYCKLSRAYGNGILNFLLWFSLAKRLLYVTWYCHKETRIEWNVIPCHIYGSKLRLGSWCNVNAQVHPRNLFRHITNRVAGYKYHEPNLVVINVTIHEELVSWDGRPYLQTNILQLPPNRAGSRSTFVLSIVQTSVFLKINSVLSNSSLVLYRIEMYMLLQHRNGKTFF